MTAFLSCQCPRFWKDAGYVGNFSAVFLESNLVSLTALFLKKGEGMLAKTLLFASAMESFPGENLVKDS